MRSLTIAACSIHTTKYKTYTITSLDLNDTAVAPAVTENIIHDC